MTFKPLNPIPFLLSGRRFQVADRFHLHGALGWITGATFHIEEVECRAMGAKACVWEINKQPKEHL